MLIIVLVFHCVAIRSVVGVLFREYHNSNLF